MCKNVDFLSVLCVYYLAYRKDMEMKSMQSKLEDEQSLVAQLQRKIRELQVRTLEKHYCKVIGVWNVFGQNIQYT